MLFHFPPEKQKQKYVQVIKVLLIISQIPVKIFPKKA